jgi:two-component system CheB/CheR fusion protein
LPPDIANHRELDPLEHEPVFPALEKVADRVVLQHCAPAGVVVDTKLQVLQFRGVTAPYLEHKPGAANLNLLKMLREELVVPVRTILAKAAKQQNIVRKDVVVARVKDQHRHLQISVVPFKAPPHKEPLFLVLFEEGARLDLPELKFPRGARSHPAKAGSDREVQHLREELEVTRESLQAIIEEQEATNEELKSANEESQSTNEELQSTNEELETAKEEMQSTNEELATVNDELRHSNQDATRANNDLINLLASVQIPVVMVDPDLKIRRFTPSAQRFFSLIPTDIGRSLSDIKLTFAVEDLDAAIREVMDTLHLKEVHVRDREGRWFALRIRPYRTKDNRIDGAVLALIDIDEFKRGLEHLGDMLWEPFLTLSKDLRVIKANQVFYEKFQVSPDDTEGCYVYDLGNRQWDNPKLRKLLEEILPEHSRIKDFPIEHKFPRIGPRKMLLNARRVEGNANGHEVILLAMRDLTPEADK